MAVVRSIEPLACRVDDPLIAEEIGVGLARSLQLGDEVFIGVQFKGTQGLDDAHGHVVITVEMAEYLVALLREAVAGARVVAR